MIIEVHLKVKKNLILFDQNILFLQGDTRVYIYEVVPEEPYFIECSSFNSPEPHKVSTELPSI